MGIAGNLATMSVMDLLQFLEAGVKSGILKVSRENTTKEIFFEKGTIVGSTSNDPKEYFGQFLLHYGKIDEPQLRLALERQRQNICFASAPWRSCTTCSSGSRRSFNFRMTRRCRKT